MEAARLLKYRPNRVAQSLKWNSSNMIGLILPDIRNPYYPELARGVQDRARALGMQVLVGNTDYNMEHELAYVDLMIGQRVDGIIFATPAIDQTQLKRLSEEGSEAVLVDHVAGDRLHVSSVHIDNEKEAALAVSYLVRLGHRRIAFLSGPTYFEHAGLKRRVLSNSHPRMLGYRRGLESSGLTMDPDLILEGDYSAQSGKQAFQTFWSLANRPTAVLSANDLMAIGFMSAAHEAGVSIPGDCAIVGYDDIPLASLVWPQLTTVSTPKYEMGVEAVNLLAQRIRAAREGEVLPHREVTLPCQLMVRRSCGGLPEA